MVDEQLAVRAEQIGERDFPLRRVEDVILIDFDPRQFPPLPLMLMTAGIFATTYLGILAVRGLFDTETMLATTKRIRLLLGWSAKAP